MLEKLVPDIKKTADLVKDIAAASAEQSSGASQVNKAVQELDKIIQQNASASEEMASSSEELASQAEQLQSTIEFFKVSDGTGRGAGGAVRARQSAPVAPTSSPFKSGAPKAKPMTAQSRGAKAAAAPAGVAIDLAGNGHADADGQFERF
jgi:methyl-accepting chemotaxis protein